MIAELACATVISMHFARITAPLCAPILVAAVLNGCTRDIQRPVDTGKDVANIGPLMAADEPASQEELASGKLIYNTHCARCHGADVKDDTYPFILTLDGLGKRYTLEQILEETWATGFVAPQQFSDEEQRAMAKFIATL